MTFIRLACLLAALPLICAAEPIPGMQQWPLRPAAEHPATADDDFADLAPLGAQLGQARVVALGEQTHGGSEEVRTKLRLLRYLHEKLGFDVLLLESGFYDMGRLSQAMARGESLDALAPGNVFFMYANSAEGRELLRYIERQRDTLALAGIDSQHSGTLSRTTLLDGLQAASELPADEPAWESYRRHVLSIIALQRQAPDARDQAAFFAFSQRLQRGLCTSSAEAAVGSATWWCRVAASLDAQARSLWSHDADYQRDNAMGANAVWLADQLFHGRKVVIWAHTVHVAKGLRRDDEHLQAGEVMNRHWGARYQVIHFTAKAGAYRDFGDLSEKSLPPPPADSLEARLPAQALLLKSEAPLRLPQYSIDYLLNGLPVPLQLGTHWDWLIALPKISPVRMTR